MLLAHLLPIIRLTTYALYLDCTNVFTQRNCYLHINGVMVTTVKIERYVTPSYIR